MYNFLVRDLARAASVVVVVVALMVSALLLTLPDESVSVEYSVLRYHTLEQITLLQYSLNVWWLFPSGFAKHILCYIWAYWLPFTFLIKGRMQEENFIWYSTTWKPSAAFLLLLLVAIVTVRLTGRRLPLQPSLLLAVVVGLVALALVVPVIFFKLVLSNVFILVKIDSLFFFFVYFVYSAVVLLPVSNLVSSVSSKI